MDYNQLISSLLSSSNQLYSIAADREKTKQAQRESALARSQQQQQFQQQMQAQQDRYNQQSALSQAQTAEEQRRYDEGGALRQSELQRSLLGQKSLGLDVESKGMELGRVKAIESISQLPSDQFLEQLKKIDQIKAFEFEAARHTARKEDLGADEQELKLNIAKKTRLASIQNSLLGLEPQTRMATMTRPDFQNTLKLLDAPEDFISQSDEERAAYVATMSDLNQVMSDTGGSGEAGQTNFIGGRQSLSQKILDPEAFKMVDDSISLAIRKRSSGIDSYEQQMEKFASGESRPARIGFYNSALRQYSKARDLIVDPETKKIDLPAYYYMQQQAIALGVPLGKAVSETVAGMHNLSVSQKENANRKGKQVFNLMYRGGMDETYGSSGQTITEGEASRSALLNLPRLAESPDEYLDKIDILFDSIFERRDALAPPAYFEYRGYETRNTFRGGEYRKAPVKPSQMIQETESIKPAISAREQVKNLYKEGKLSPEDIAKFKAIGII